MYVKKVIITEKGKKSRPIDIDRNMSIRQAEILRTDFFNLYNHNEEKKVFVKLEFIN